MESKTCAYCNETVSGVFAADFKAGICLPCQCYIESQEDEHRTNVELARYNRKHDTTYDSNEFYFACDNGEIDRSSLKRLPLLRDIYDFMVRVRAEQAYITIAEKRERQLNIFKAHYDLPF